MRKPTICKCENKGADQRLCFRYTDSTNSLLLISKISRILPASVTVQAGLCQTWSETQIVSFPMWRLSLIIISGDASASGVVTSNCNIRINLVKGEIGQQKVRELDSL